MKIGHECESKISNSMNLTSSQMSQIGWRYFNEVTQQMKKVRRIQIMKMIHNHWPTMSREFDWKRASSNLCPICQQAPETRSHIFQCTHDAVCEQRATELKQLRENLQKVSSHPLIVKHLYQIAEDFTNGRQTSHIPIHDKNLREL